MDAGDLEVLKEAVVRAARESTDGGLLDLIYRLLTSE